MHFRGILTPLAIGATLSLFTQGTFACSPNCSSEGCTVVDDPEQYSFNANAASRAAGSASDCEDIYNSWPTGEDPFSEETWEGGDCVIRLIKASTKNCISWDQLRTVTRFMLDEACDGDTCKGGMEPKSARDDSYSAFAGASLCVMGSDSTCWVPGNT